MVAELSGAAVTWLDPGYPPLLRQIPDPPLVLHVRGSAVVLSQPAVAVVGSRAASDYAINAARSLARDLSHAGLTIVAGLARGVDAAAHSAVLDAGGTTIGILGTGIDVVYPRENRRLFRRIEETGAIATEFPPGTAPLPQNFPVRNRIVAGLCLGAVIVEATSRSGSLITARLAADQGREVFAVPGPIFSAGSEGPHRLIQYGAKLVHDADDVLAELRGFTPRVETPAAAVPPGEWSELLRTLRYDEGLHVDTAAARLGRTSREIAEGLLQLELGGWVRALPGARYIRTERKAR